MKLIIDGGMKCKNVVNKPMIPSIWHVQKGTNILQDEMKYF
jgi:hypothetical protein